MKSIKTEDETYIHVIEELMNELVAQCHLAKINKRKAGCSRTGIKVKRKNEAVLLFSNQLGVPYHPSSITSFWRKFINA